jgi:hypothetical protein
MSPNLIHLTLITHKYSSTSLTSNLPDLCNLILSSLNPIHIHNSTSEKINRTILPPVPFLTHLEVDYQVDVPDGSNPIEQEIEAARNITVKHLVSRHEKGACYLELTEFVYDTTSYFKVLKFSAMENKEQANGSNNLILQKVCSLCDVHMIL